VSGDPAYRATIRETDRRNGTFIAEGHDLTVTSRDPEHALCRALVAAGVVDGPVQFYRGETPSLSFRSIYRAAQWRVTQDLKRARWTVPPSRNEGSTVTLGSRTGKTGEGGIVIPGERAGLYDEAA